MIFITQPTYMPWIGYFSFLLKSKKIIFLDDVQFSRRSWQQRNKIKHINEELLLTVPVISKGKKNQNINEVRINNKTNFVEKHLKSISLSYKKCKYFSRFI